MNMNTVPRVQVLLSAYNGSAYIEQQVKSILEQEKVETRILVRDDGSKDDTTAIVEKMVRTYPERIKLEKGKNLGYRRSFLHMLALADKTAEYFAFADQDDVWEKDKLVCAVSMLCKQPECWLYASALKITEENLQILGISGKSNLKQTLGSFFVRTRLAGCTMVFTKELLKVALHYSNLQISHETAPDHDALLCMLCMLYGKKIAIDPTAHILHRRHEAAQTSGGRGLMNRVQVESKRIFHRKHSYCYTARLLLQEDIDWEKDERSTENYKLLQNIAKYGDKKLGGVRLCMNKEISCGIKAADILIRCKMLLGIY